MKERAQVRASEVVDSEWVGFPGGELEGRRPRVLCPACRAKRPAHPERRTPHPECGTPHQPLCFACYRASLERDRAIKAASALDTGTDARFQYVLPLEPVNRARLDGLRTVRESQRVQEQTGNGRYANRRRHAQIEARHALARVFAELRDRSEDTAVPLGAVADAVHAAELQLPAAWLPFVCAR